MAAGAVELLADALEGDAGLAEAGGGEGGSGASSGGGGSEDVLDQAGRFFAEQGGSLNIETQVIDGDGVQLS